jgi:hypothetical protein
MRGIGALDQQEQAVGQHLRLVGAELVDYPAEPLAEPGLAGLDDEPAGMALVAKLDRRIRHQAAVEARLLQVSGHMGDDRAQAGHRLGAGGGELVVEFRHAFGREAFEACRDQCVLGFEAAVEAGLGDPRLADDLVHADRADPALAEELERRLEDPGSRGLAGRIGAAAAPFGQADRHSNVRPSFFLTECYRAVRSTKGRTGQ